MRALRGIVALSQYEGTLRIELPALRVEGRSLRAKHGLGVLFNAPVYGSPYRCRSCRDRFFRTGDPLAAHAGHRMRRYGFHSKSAGA